MDTTFSIKGPWQELQERWQQDVHNRVDNRGGERGGSEVIAQFKSRWPLLPSTYVPCLFYFSIQYYAKCIVRKHSSTLYANFQLHCSSHGFSQCGMQIYVMADTVTHWMLQMRLLIFILYFITHTFIMYVHFCLYIHCMYIQE